MTDNKETSDVTALVLSLRNDQGMGVNRIASMLGIGSGRVACILADAGLRKEKRESDQALRERIIELRKAGHSSRSIAKEVGWSETVVYRAITAVGLNGWDAQRELRKSARDPLEDEILLLYRDQGLPIVDVAARLGTGKARIARVVQSAGVYRAFDALTDDERAEIIRLRGEGLATAAIAERIDRSPGAVRDHLEKHGLNKRILRPVRVVGDVAYVPLTQGKTATIDAADVHLIAGHNWSALKMKRANGTVAYYASKGGGKSSQHQLMHRVIMGDPPGKIIDHGDHDGLNNRRFNLKITDHRGNGHNARRVKDTGLPRLVRKTKYGKLFAQVTASTKPVDTIEEAVADRDALLRHIHGADAAITEKIMPEVIDPDTGEVLDG